MRRIFLFCLLSFGLACSSAAAQDEALQSFNPSEALIATALLTSDVVEEWARDYEGEEGTGVEVVLDLETDSTGVVRSVRVLSAPGFGSEASERMAEVVRPLLLPELSNYDGELTFTLRREPMEAKELSPVLVGVIAGLTVAVTIVLTSLFQ